MRRAIVLGCALAFAAPASAAEIKNVDASRYPEIGVTVVTATSEPPGLRENGRPAPGLEAENLGRAKSLVLALDRSQSMKGQALADALRAARAFVARKSPGDRIAIVGFGSTAVQLTGFSSSTIDSDLALRDLEVDGQQGTALNDAVALGARMLGRESSPARVLVLLTDGRDVSSSTTWAAATAAARGNGVNVYTVGIESAQFSPKPLRELATVTGGTYRGASSSSELSGVYGALSSELARTWRLTYVTAARPGDRLELSAGDGRKQVALPGESPALARPAPSSIVPETAYEGWGSLAVGLLVGLLLLLAVALLAGARKASWLRSRLAPHLVSERAVAQAKRERNRERVPVGSTLLNATERAFGHLAWWKRVHRQLERADVPLRTAELVWVSVASAFAVGLVAALAARSTLMILGGFVLGALLPFAYLKLKARKRLKAFENQLPDLLLTLAASLKAGHSFKQGLQTVVDEGLPPASKELTRVLAEARLGRPMEDALNEMAERVNSKNFRFVITAVTIQSQVGGSLAGLFDMIAETVRQRHQFARKIRGLTAMGRASAYVLVGLPFFTAGIITVINADFMEPLYHTSTGHKLLAMGATMMALGSLMLKKIVSFRG